jgi:hypothetical protein
MRCSLAWVTLTFLVAAAASVVLAVLGIWLFAAAFPFYG